MIMRKRKLKNLLSFHKIKDEHFVEIFEISNNNSNRSSIGVKSYIVKAFSLRVN